MTTEIALWQEYKTGDKQAFSTLYEKYYCALYNYGFHLVPDKELVRDCLHDLFFYLWENQAQIVQPVSVKSYLFTAFKRKLFDAIQARQRFSAMDAESDFEITISFEQQLISEQTSAENIQKLQHAINKLTKRQREVIFLRYYENMSYGEIASVMECDINSVYVQASRALDALRNAYCLTSFLVWLSAIHSTSGS